jgi:ketosteroid isomerase-like protein
MTAAFPTPQDAEDAFYDAIEERDIPALLAVWEDTDEVACLLPMRPFVHGRGPLEAIWRDLLGADFPLDIQVRHVRWVEAGELAIHYLEERVQAPGQGPPQPAIYATNVFRKGPSGWRLILHQNAPAPPPPGAVPPGVRG